jgi:hypothetical protein
MRLAAPLACAAALAVSAANAQTLSRQQSNAVNHLAQVMAIELECPQYEANTLSLALLLSGYKLDIGSEPVSTRIQKLVAEHRAGLRAAGPKVGCVMAWGLYGPGGQNVQDMIRRK